jgi:type IV pilus assembly protein PilM
LKYLRKKMSRLMCLLKQDLRRDLKVGFDFGTYSIKTAVVDNSRGKIISFFETVNIPDRELKDQKEDRKVIQKKIRRLIQKYSRNIPKFANRTSAVLQGEGIISNFIVIPNVSDRELDTVVMSKAINFIPFPIEDINIDYIKVPTIDSREREMGIFFVAAKKEIVQVARDFLDECGFKIARFETPIFPLIREFKKNHKLEDDKFIALVHVGFKYSYAIIVRNGYPYFSREFKIGGSDFTYAFQAHNQVNWNEAEKIKLTVDLENPQVAIRPFVKDWLKELTKSIQFFENQFKEQNVKVEKIYLSGGSAGMKNFDRIISENLGLETITDNWEKIKTSKNKQTQQPYKYKIAVGLTIDN